MGIVDFAGGTVRRAVWPKPQASGVAEHPTPGAIKLGSYQVSGVDDLLGNGNGDSFKRHEIIISYHIRYDNLPIKTQDGKDTSDSDLSFAA